MYAKQFYAIISTFFLLFAVLLSLHLYVYYLLMIHDFLSAPQLALPEGTQARLRHTVTAFSLEPERTQVTMLGGCPKWDLEKPPEAQAKIAETTVLEFG